MSHTDTYASQKPLPGTDRLLRGIRGALARISTRLSDDHTRSELGAIDTILGELLLRRDAPAQAQHYASLRLLAEEGLALLRDRLQAGSGEAVLGILSVMPEALDPTLDYEVNAIHINRILYCLEVLVDAARGDVPATIQQFTSRVLATENAYQAMRIACAAPVAIVQPAYTVFTRDSMQTYLRAKFPERQGLRVPHFRQLVSGYQKITALFEIEDDSGRRDSLVLRAEKDDRFLTLDAGNVVDEYAIVKIAHDAGIPVAEPMWLEDDASRLGYRFFVSRRVEGENHGSAIGADKPIGDTLARSFIQTMGCIHQMPVSEAIRHSALGRWLNFASLEENTRANVLYWKDQTWMRQANPSPLYTRLATWLLDNVPRDDDTPRFTHGDFGPHNVLAHDGKVSGVLDWESAHIGDQAEDIAWFLQSCAGKISAAQALDWYEEFTGWRIHEYRLRYFDVFNCLKVLTGAMSACPMFETLENASIEWCNIPLRWAPFSAAQVEGLISAAEAVKP